MKISLKLLESEKREANPIINPKNVFTFISTRSAYSTQLVGKGMARQQLKSYSYSKTITLTTLCSSMPGLIILEIEVNLLLIMLVSGWATA